MKRLHGLLFFLTVLMAQHSLAAQSTICTITINSNHEREALRELYGQQANIVELVPEDNRDPQWLDKACRSGVQCDALLVSGHFGGVFFGEGHSTTLDLHEIERRSCDNSCPGIFQKPKDVFLMGCNTLSTKTPDKRSTEEYVEVLLHNGFPRDLAERVAFARYSNYGVSIGQIFASAFPHAQRLHGFTSTSPLGKYAGPQLKKALAKTSASQFFSQGPDLRSLRQTFAGVGFRIVEPAKEADPMYHRLTCNSLSKNTEDIDIALQLLTHKDNLRKYYEPLLRAAKDKRFLKILQNKVKVQSQLRKNFAEFFQDIAKSQALPLKMRFQLLELQKDLGLIDTNQMQTLKIIHLRQRLSEGINFIVTDQVCSMKEQVADIELKYSWFLRSSNGLEQFLPRLASCFGRYDTDTFQALYRMAAISVPSVRREALRTLSPSLTNDDKTFFFQVAEQWRPQDQMELSYITHVIGQQQELPPQVQQCLHQAKTESTAEARDGYRWHCYNSMETAINSPLKCHQVAREFETDSGSGLAWNCLTRFNETIHLGACFESANMIVDLENSDDVRWYCWSKLHERNRLSRSECLALASSMKVQGNQFKANWNCMNRVGD